ncbi:MAG: YbhB/YbcL family Raf kinase inhibitor-like protein [bacterium JZ-2024 1]
MQTSWLRVIRGLVVFAMVILASGCQKQKSEEAPADGEEVTGPGGPETGQAAVFRLTSTAFKDGEAIPGDYTCDGRNVSPPLSWENAPKGAEGFAIIMDDPDAPRGTFTHWIIVNIPANETGLQEGIPKTEKLENGAIQGKNSAGEIGYFGPCPPSGTHRYIFRIYALHMKLDLQPGADIAQVEATMRDHIMGKAELMGTYSRQ